MFTGIITCLGKIENLTSDALTVSANRHFLSKIAKGTSISVNGICLTATDVNKKVFQTDIMPETYQRTHIRYLQIDDLVNLELPATPQAFLSGHIVYGHIDGVCKLLEIKQAGNSRILKFSSFPALAKCLVAKGSVAINGISLTVIKAEKNYFTVGIILYTWTKTMLHTLKTGSFVNIETDILVKTVQKFLKDD